MDKKSKSQRGRPESFRPKKQTAPERSAVSFVKFYARMLLDLQSLTIYHDLRRLLPGLTGSVLDVGCGDSPYRFLLDPSKTEYVGLDIHHAEHFDYGGAKTVFFDGARIPFEGECFNAILCTETLEHAEDVTTLVAEMLRVLKPGGVGIFTIPWSARYHYIPFDYLRFTPSALNRLFGNFRSVEIHARGADFAVVVSKVVVIWFRNLVPARLTPANLAVGLPLALALTPLVLVLVGLGHLSLWLSLGSEDDPLGYTVIARKA